MKCPVMIIARTMSIPHPRKSLAGDNRWRGIVFDLDGTLYPMRGIKVRMTFALWRKLNLLRCLSPARASLRSRTFADASALNAALYQELSRRSGFSSDEVAKWYQDEFLMEFVRVLNKYAKKRPGLVALLELLHKSGLKLAVVSDFGRVGERLTALGIRTDVFDNVMATEEFGVLKPSPKPLRALAQKWNLSPSALLLVGDRQDLDGASAEAAGMTFIGISDRTTLFRNENGFINWAGVTKLLKAQVE